MIKTDFSDVAVWVFDLDHTLYPAHNDLFAQIEPRMTAYIARLLQVSDETANDLRDAYWVKYGTSLAGLMAEHDIDPDPFLEDVHDIDFTVLSPDERLKDALSHLPGRKIIYTNGTRPYAHNVLAALGLTGAFDAIYGVEHAQYRPKPERAAFDAVFARDALNPARAAMFEDSIRNLVVPHQLGMKTVHVAPMADPQDHIHHHTADLAAFLSQLV